MDGGIDLYESCHPSDLAWASRQLNPPPRTSSNPTGAEMVRRNEIHYSQVKAILPDFPTSRGDDLELWIIGLRKHYWRSVRISQEPKGGALAIIFPKRKNLYMIPMPESYRRRRQEIQHDEREKIWVQAASNLGIVDFQDSEWRKTEGAKREFSKLAKGNPYLPSERVQRKRWRNEEAQRHSLSGQQLSVMDNYSRA